MLPMSDDLPLHPEDARAIGPASRQGASRAADDPPDPHIHGREERALAPTLPSVLGTGVAVGVDHRIKDRDLGRVPTVTADEQ